MPSCAVKGHNNIRTVALLIAKFELPKLKKFNLHGVTNIFTSFLDVDNGMVHGHVIKS